MRVNREGETRIGVAEAGLRGLHVDSVGDHAGRTGTTQVVKRRQRCRDLAHTPLPSALSDDPGASAQVWR
jgi:hypothetical protein